MVLNATFNNISVISWRSVLLVEDTGVPWENHWPVTNHRQPVSYNVVSSTPHLSGIQNCNVSLDRHWLWLKWLNNQLHIMTNHPTNMKAIRPTSTEEFHLQCQVGRTNRRTNEWKNWQTEKLYAPILSYVGNKICTGQWVPCECTFLIS